ncbi:MAG: molybdopterin molybdotransferase MoeA, partial [Pseudomonadota bacterium]
MISVAQALDLVLALGAPMPGETVPLREAAGRMLAADVHAGRDQPPFPASAMDGYAIQQADYVAGRKLRVLGEAAAGSGYAGAVTPGTCVRIFTGAPVPEGATRVVIQEDVEAEDGGITLRETSESGAHIRPAGADFTTGQALRAPFLLTPQHIALLASMNVAQVPVVRRPRVALISTGSELVMPGENPGPDQIIASNTFGLHAMLNAAGADAKILPIAHDNVPALKTAFNLARGADLIVTIGGASVGDHDLVGDVAAELGMKRAFYKIAMRPGKPLMAGQLHGAAMVGLPGNPVSAMVCGVIFLRPLIRKML